MNVFTPQVSIIGDEIWRMVPDTAFIIPILLPPDVFTLGLAYLVLVRGLNIAGDRMCWALSDLRFGAVVAIVVDLLGK